MRTVDVSADEWFKRYQRVLAAFRCYYRRERTKRAWVDAHPGTTDYAGVGLRVWRTHCRWEAFARRERHLRNFRGPTFVVEPPRALFVPRPPRDAAGSN